MATVPINISFTIVDQLGTKASAFFPGSGSDAQTVAALLTYVDTVSAAMDAVTAGQITAVRVELGGSLSGLKSSPVAGSRVEQTAIVNLATATSPHRYGQIVPAVDDSLISSGHLTTGGVVGAL